MLLPGAHRAPLRRMAKDVCAGTPPRLNARRASLLELPHGDGGVSERGMNVAEVETGNVRDDLVWSQPLMLVPYHHVEHADTVAGNAGLAATYAWGFSDPSL